MVKVGSSSLTTAAGAIDDARIAQLTEVLTSRVRGGGQVVLVSSGAIAAGLAPLGLPRRPGDLATQQAAASVGQGLLMARYSAAFAARGVQAGQILLTADDLMRRAHYRNAQRTLNRLLELGILPVVNENDTVATDEIRFGDNDRLAALVAHVVRAGALILLSDVDGLHDKDPRQPGARLIGRVKQADGRPWPGRRARAGRALGHRRHDHQGGRGPDRDRGRHPHRGGQRRSGGRRAGRRSRPGTYLRPARPPARHPAAVARPRCRRPGQAAAGRWRGPGGGSRPGLAAARRDHRGRGHFDAGDPVDLCDAGGQVIARGLVNYDAAEVPALMGRDTRSLAAELGPEYEREVVHRDDLVRAGARMSRAPSGTGAGEGRLRAGLRCWSGLAAAVVRTAVVPPSSPLLVSPLPLPPGSRRPKTPRTVATPRRPRSPRIP